jgi:hypothetical protein
MQTASAVKFNASTGTVTQDNVVIPFTSSDSGTLTVGQGIVLGCMPIKLNEIFGFVSTRTSGNFGSYSPTGLTGGKTVAQVDDVETGTCITGGFSVLTVSGFSSNPGNSWLSSITCNGFQNLARAATAFSYGTGDATLEWSHLLGLSSKSGSNVGCAIVHN